MRVALFLYKTQLFEEEKIKVITEAYYSALLDNFKNYPTLFHHESPPANRSTVAMANVHAVCFDLLPHPLYSADLALRDFFSFPKLKNSFCSMKYSANQECVDAVNYYFYWSFLNGLEKLKNRWIKCVGLKGMGLCGKIQCIYTLILIYMLHGDILCRWLHA